MTDRLDRIEARANAATEGPWDRFDAQIRHTQIDGWVDPVGRAAAQAQTESDIQFVMNARTDIPALTAALRAVLGLAARWESRGEHEMAFSKTVPDEDIAMALLTDGAAMVENARHIRNAVNDALEGGE